MSKELELLGVEIDKTKDKISETATGMTLLGVFFLAIIPLFYAIMGIYNFAVDNIRVALVVCVSIMLLATLLSVMQWEINSKRLKALYAKKSEMITAIEDKKIEVVAVHKGKK